MGIAVSELGTILGVWAHPDDEAYLVRRLDGAGPGRRITGGLRDGNARRAGHGRSGDAGRRTGWPRERTVELARCLEILGVSEHHWLGYADGGCAAVPAAEAVARLCEVIERGRAGHGGDVRAGRQHRPPGPPDGVGVGHRGVRPGRPAGRAAAAGGGRPSGGPGGGARLNERLGVFAARLPGHGARRPARGRPGAGRGDRRPQGAGAGGAGDADDRAHRRDGRRDVHRVGQRGGVRRAPS